MTHLEELEAQAIFIFREVVATSFHPVMLYSIGKDSSVMLHIAQKAFAPAKLPFPVLHVDTTWKFKEMIAFRDQRAKELDLDLIVFVNPEGREKQINPFVHGSGVHTDIMKTQALRKVLNQYQFDAILGGARRDEEKSRAKERIFSFRDSQHRWNPRNQRPEFWNIYNSLVNKGESMRVFPLSNWTEQDIWLYIYLEKIPNVPLYLAKKRPVVEREGMLIMVDDERMELKESEKIQEEMIRFRTLGCYPLTGAVRSHADTLEKVLEEIFLTRSSERQGRMIDKDIHASMEQKKIEGYF